MYVFLYCSTIIWQNWQLSAGIALKSDPELPCFGLANQVLAQHYISKFLPILVLMLRQSHQVTKHASIIMWPLGLLHFQIPIPLLNVSVVDSRDQSMTSCRQNMNVQEKHKKICPKK